MAEALGVDAEWLATGEGIGPAATEAPEGLGRKAVQVNMPDGFFDRLVEAVEADPRPITTIERDARVSNAWLSRLVRQTKAARLDAAEPADRPMLSLPHAVAVARTLGVRSEWLLERTGPRRPGEEPAPPAAVARADDPRLDALLAKVDEKRTAFDRARHELTGACDAASAYLRGGTK